MVVAVYADLKFYQSEDQDLYFVKRLIKNISDNYKEHQFYFVVPQIIDEVNDISISTVTLNLKSGPFYKYRSNRKFLQVVKKLKADAVLSIDTAFNVSVPQGCLVTDLKGKNQFLKEWHKLLAIFVFSERMKDELVNQHKVDQQKIKVIHGGPAKLFSSLSDDAKSLIKENYTDGKEYFIYRGSIAKENNIVPLLKGFSLFKKRQKSSMKLVLTGKLVWQKNEFDNLLNTYKYRDDVVINDNVNLTSQAELIGAAYACIQPYAGSNLLFAFDTMESNVPLLADCNSVLNGIDTNVALYFNAVNDDDIADKMMMVYKDEYLRSQLVERGKKFVSHYSWEQSVEAVWRNLQQP